MKWSLKDFIPSSVCILVVIALVPAGALGQTTASIFGTITDASRGVLPGVAVTATNALTNDTRTAATGEHGTYSFPSLALGTYRVQAELAGFRTSVRQGIELSLNRNARVDFELQIGNMVETVIVIADAPLVETTSNEMGTLVDQRRITDLPLNGRNTLALVSLIPGAQQLESGPEQGFNVNKAVFNGTRPELSNWLLDGGDNTSTLRNYGNPVPNPDSVQEFRVISNNYSAEYGRSAGAVVNVVTKSGTNEFHGSAFEFLRNDSLNGDNFFLGAPTKLDQHQFGGTVGGRLVRDKTFFFASYQGFRRNRETFLNSALVPTALERQGDFSQSVFQGKPVAVNDPLAGAPFEARKIPAARISPIAARFLESVVPLPNNPARGPNGYSITLPLEDPSDEMMFKIDHVLSQNHRLSGSYFINDSVTAEAVSQIPYQ